jgi:uncharacterized RDD family membrane protein YckC
MYKIKVNTTQNVNIEYEAASIGDRILATLIDALIIYGYMFALFVMIINFADAIGAGNISSEVWVLIIVVLFALPYLLYDLVSEIFMNGQTIGKKQRNIRVIRLDGRQATLGDYFLRWLLRPLDMMFFGSVAVIFVSANGKGQRIGDVAANTAVIKIRAMSIHKDLTLLEHNDLYVPQFLQVSLLSDADINIIREAILVYKQKKDTDILRKVAQKTKQVLQIESKAEDLEVLETVIKDYTYLAEKEA